MPNPRREDVEQAIRAWAANERKQRKLKQLFQNDQYQLIGDQMSFNTDEIFSSNYLKSSDLNEVPHDVTIHRTGEETMRDGKVKAAVWFFEFRKPLLLNATNHKSLVNLHGKDNSQWGNKRACLYPTQADYGGESFEVIRIREATPGPTVQTEPQPAPQPRLSEAAKPEPDMNDPEVRARVLAAYEQSQASEEASTPPPPGQQNGGADVQDSSIPF